MDRLNALEAFVAVSDAKGFAAGGRRLGLSPPAVTRLISGLEDRLGARLLQRTTRTLSLTDAGRRYLERARQLLADLQEAEETIRAERGAPSGRLVVAAPRMFGRLHVAPMVSRFMQRFDQVSTELQLNDRNVNLIEEGIDVAIRIGTLADSNLVARQLGETRRVVVASPSYLERRGQPADPAELNAHDIVAFSSLDAVPAWEFAREDESTIKLPLSPRFSTNSAEAALDHVERGGGLTRVLAYQAAEGIRSGRLEIVLAKFETPPVPISVVYPSSRLLSTKVRAFIDLLVGETDWRFVELRTA